MGAACSGTRESQDTASGTMDTASRADAKAGMCRAWHTWQGVSEPPVCACSRAPPQAKYNMAAQASSATERARYGLADWRKKILMYVLGAAETIGPHRKLSDARNAPLVT
jgi:hypothetical protein